MLALAAGEPAPQQQHPALIAAPSEAYLPACARKVMGEYARNTYQHADPRIALFDNPQMTPSRNLMFNLTLDDYHGDEEKLRAAIRYLAWFLPRTYNILPMPVGWDQSSFVPLG